MVTMTYPHIGNYGINEQDSESCRPWVSGFIVKELSPVVSNYRSEMSLGDYLKKYKIVGIEGIDTRRLVKHLRDFGAKKGIISTVESNAKRLVQKANDFPGIVGIDLVKEVTCREAYDFTDGLLPEFIWPGNTPKAAKKYFIVCVDCGIKFNILRKLNQHGFRVKIVPAKTTAEEILKLKPDGVFYSNGPGDPEPVTYVWQELRKLIGRVPVFGICLGHQMLGLALGGKTFKLKFGHRGGNHPVMDLKTKRIEITSPNHGFCVDLESLPKDDVEITHMNLNDKTLEGFQYKKLPAFCVQYHPENSPGPHDSDYLFHRFYNLVDKGAW
jgi:carbamoyl-phosphate synthase small subunit